MKIVKITKNKKLDIGYIELKKSKIFETKRVGRDVVIDLDKHGNAIGIELLTLGKKPTPKKKSKRRSA